MNQAMAGSYSYFFQCYKDLDDNLEFQEENIEIEN